MTVCKYIFYLPPEALYQFLGNGLCELVVCNRASRNICLLDCTFNFFIATVGFPIFLYSFEYFTYQLLGRKMLMLHNNHDDDYNYCIMST